MKAQDAGTLQSTRTAGKAFDHVIRALQHNHGMKEDGVYGPLTHALVAPHFDKVAAGLYASAKIRVPAGGGYVNPFHLAAIQTGRIDQGVDFHGRGPICVLGDCHVVGLGGRGWPGGEYVLYRLEKGAHAGRYVYVAEAIVPTVRAGQSLKAGQVLAFFRHDAFPGQFPGIETGWGTPTVNLTYAAWSGNTGGSGHSLAPAGLAFARLLKRLGVPNLSPGSGPEFP